MSFEQYIKNCKVNDGCNCDKNCNKETYLTKDPLKVEWVKLGCDEELENCDGKTCYKYNEEGEIIAHRVIFGDKWERCNQLKNLIK